MRTTVQLPPELMRAAKVRAAEHGISLKEFFSRAVAEELGRRTVFVREGAPARAAVARPPSDRVSLPLFGSPRRKGVRLTNVEIEEVFAKEDAEKYGGRRK